MYFLSFFRLIRWKNLLIIFIIQALIQFFLIPKFEQNQQLTIFNFFLFTLASVFIGGAGYIINDIFDIKIDAINKPEKVIIGPIISSSIGLTFYTLFNLTGIILGMAVSLLIGAPKLTVIYILISLLLFLYSYSLKSKPLIGNIIIAFIVSSCIFIFIFFEQISMDSLLFKIIITYAAFAFIINIIREMIKDIEDINGDVSNGLNTLPILIGVKRAKQITMAISLLMTIALVTVLVLNKDLNIYTKSYGLAIVIIPLSLFISKLYKANSKNDYHKLSVYLKIIMISGMLSIITL